MTKFARIKMCFCIAIGECLFIPTIWPIAQCCQCVWSHCIITWLSWSWRSHKCTNSDNQTANNSIDETLTKTWYVRDITAKDVQRLWPKKKKKRKHFFQTILLKFSRNFTQNEIFIFIFKHTLLEFLPGHLRYQP